MLKKQHVFNVMLLDMKYTTAKDVYALMDMLLDLMVDVLKLLFHLVELINILTLSLKIVSVMMVVKK
jgi:hypothetical protein